MIATPTTTTKTATNMVRTNAGAFSRTITAALGAESAPSTPDAEIARAVKRYEPGLQPTENDGADVV